MAEPDKDDLNKTEQINIRVSRSQRDRLAEAAEIVSRERGEVVEPITLARELIVSGADEIRARKTAAA